MLSCSEAETLSVSQGSTYLCKPPWAWGSVLCRAVCQAAGGCDTDCCHGLLSSLKTARHSEKMAVGLAGVAPPAKKQGILGVWNISQNGHRGQVKCSAGLYLVIPCRNLFIWRRNMWTIVDLSLQPFHLGTSKNCLLNSGVDRRQGKREGLWGAEILQLGARLG